MKAFEFIAKQSDWTKGCYAQDKYGKPCSPNSVQATQWDIVGAIRKVYGDNTKGYWLAFKTLRKEIRRMGFMEISFWQDSPLCTHRDVVNLLKRFDI